MPDRVWVAEAPSNIALIKYMGKVEGQGNRPTNSSLSWTLPHLRTRVEVEASESEQWQPLQRPGWQEVRLSEAGQRRYLSHWQFLKKELGIQGSFTLKSANNFPADCGLASSASSFAALTMVAQNLACEQGQSPLEISKLADLSRQGSGSSCRSFFQPWSVWDESGVRGLKLPIKNLCHQAILVSGGKKSVSSSQAHRQVTTSLLFSGRPERAQQRLDLLLEAIRAENWPEIFEIVWAEFWDMHVLFETSRPAFGYLTEGSLHVLEKIRSLWQEIGDGPVVTMDAGANVHFLYRQDQADLAQELAKRFNEKFLVFQSQSEGNGG